MQSFRTIKHPLLISFAFALLAIMSPAYGQDPVPSFYVFQNVNVIPMDTKRVLEAQTVVVRNGRIESVQASGEPVPQDAALIQGENRYLMPGLAEMHGHIPSGDDPQYAKDILFLYIANGVTFVRGMAGHSYHIQLREQLEAGELDGPTIIAAGPWLGQSNAGSKRETRKTVRQHHKEGFDLLKVGSLPAKNYPHMVDEAKKLGMPFAGHIPEGVTLEQALDAGQASIDHLDRYIEYLVPEDADLEDRESGFFGSGLIDLVDMDRIPAAVEITREAGTWNVPTLSLVEHLASGESPEDMIQWPEMQYMPDHILTEWVKAKRDFNARDDFKPDAAQRLVQVRRQLLKALHDGGAPIALGSDSPQFFNVPGFSIHHEMAMMVAAGLSPYQVLVTGTRNPADYLETPNEFGQVAAGHRADLILLDGNPLEDIGQLRNRAGVMVRGQWLPEGEIQRRLKTIAQRR